MANSPDSPISEDDQIEPASSLDKEIGSQGLKKRVIKKGFTWQTPLPGDEVEVHFSGWVNDDVSSSCFRSIRDDDNDTPLRFKLGQCEVIAGLDEGIATMKKGERAMFTVPPNLAYGDTGYPPLIPPNATLTFDVEMVTWYHIRDLTGDGGVVKKILKEGEGWATPKDGDEVTVQYEVRFEQQQQHQSSDDTDQHELTLVNGDCGCVDFHLGHGGLCPAIHIAVKTMRKREKAELTVKFSYGFGEDDASNDQNVRTSSTGLSLNAWSESFIQLELISWKRVVDVVGDGKILKKIIKAGEGFDRPGEGSLIKVVYVGKLEEDGTIFEQRGSEEAPFEYICLDEQVDEGLDRAIMTMRKGEKAQVTITTPYDDEDDSGSSRLLYQVDLIDFTKETPVFKMNTNEKISMCEKKKQEGNHLFRTGKIWQASKKYDKAVKYIEFNHSFTEEETVSTNHLRASCYLNNAACKLKLGEYKEATKLCSKVLEHDPCNVKALYRRFQAYIKMSELEEAEADIMRAIAIDPDNRDIKMELKLLKEKQKEHTVNQAKLFTTMLSKMTTA